MINNTNHIYRDNCNFVKELKNKWNRMNDPILQRNEMYAVRDKGIQQCKVNYLERIKQKEKNNNTLMHSSGIDRTYYWVCGLSWRLLSCR